MFKMAASVGLSKLRGFFYSEHSDKAFILYTANEVCSRTVDTQIRCRRIQWRLIWACTGRHINMA